MNELAWFAKTYADNDRGNANMNTMTIGTSISPKNIDNQKRAIQSWIDAGFHVFSYNAADETEKIRGYFPSVEFITADRDARREKGRPLVYLYDILQQLKRTGDKVVGIINSDIHIKNADSTMYTYLFEQAQNSLIYAHRQDVNTLDEKLGEWYIGLDLFLFDRELVDIYQDDGLVLGGCAWDYYMVFMARHFGYDAKLLQNPIAFHLRHVQTWSDWEDYNTKRKIAQKYLGEASARAVRKMDDAIRNNKQGIFKAGIEAAGSKSVLVIVPCDLKNSGTLLGIQNFSYTNIRIAQGNAQEYDFAAVQEDYVLIACDGIMYNRDFLTLAVTCLNKGFDMVSYGLEIEKEGQQFFFVHADELKQTESLDRGCSVFRRDWLCSDKSNKSPVCGNMCERFAKIDYVCYIQHTLTGRSKVYFYGAGANCDYILKHCELPEGMVVGILDSNSAVHGTQIHGIPVSGISAIKDDNDIPVFITALGYEFVIYEFLKTQLPEERIIRSYYVHDPEQKPALENVLPFFDIVLIGNVREREIFKQKVEKIYDVFYVDEIEADRLTEAYIRERKSETGEMTYFVAVSGNAGYMRDMFLKASSAYSGYFLTEDDFFSAIFKSKLVHVPQCIQSMI